MGKIKMLNRIAKMCIGCYILILMMILVIMPNLPLIGILLACKYVEAYVFHYLYGAESIHSYDFLKLSCGIEKNIRTSLVVVDGSLELKKVKDLVVTSLLDAHTSQGHLCFPQLTKKHKAGLFNHYWVEEEQFSLSDHVDVWGEECLYTNTELKQILVRLKDESLNKALSPWSFTVIPLQKNKTAIAFRCHPALRDMDVLKTFLKEHKACDHEHKEFRLLDQGYLPLVKDLSLTCWNLAEMALRTLKARTIKNQVGKKPVKSPPSEETTTRKVLMWSRPVSAKMFEQMARNLNVGLTEVLLGCVSYIVHDLDTLNYECPLLMAGPDATESVTSNFPFKSVNINPVSTIMESKEKLSDLSFSGKVFTSLLCSHVAGLILPVRLAKSIRERVTSDVKVNINTLMAEEIDQSASSLPVDLLSVWCEDDKEAPIEICLTNTMGKLIIGTDAHHTQESTARHLFQQFDQVVKKLAAETGVFTHYYNCYN